MSPIQPEVLKAAIIRSPLVVLTEIELAYSDYVAQRRLDDVRKWRRVNRADVMASDSEERNHVLGATGEHAFAKWLGRKRPMDAVLGICPSCECYAGTVNTFSRGADVGRYQIRTRSYEGAPLIVREVDKDDDVFVLVQMVGLPSVVSAAFDRGFKVVAATYQVIGWKKGVDAKQWRLRQDPKGRGVAYFVPVDELEAMMDLPGEEGHDASQEEGTQARDSTVTGPAA